MVPLRMMPLRMELAREPTTPRWAREAVAERLGDHPRRGDLLLCVSELVTNAITHARSAPTMTLAIGPERIRVEVADDEPTPPVPRPVDPFASQGRGLQLVGQLSVEWGVLPLEHGKTVWFEFETADREAHSCS